LSDSAVPVPNVLEIVDDAEVLDVPFVFMDHCPGFAINTAEDWARSPDGPGPDDKRSCAFGMIDTLAAIHAVDIDEVGLADLRRPGGLIERQLRRWLGQGEQIAMRETPMIHEVHDVLLKSIPDPAGSAGGSAHADFKPNNLIVAGTPAGIAHGDFKPDCRDSSVSAAPKAVVDPEVTAVGEVPSELGYLVAMLPVPEEATSTWVPTVEDGFPAAAELIARDQQVSG